MLYAEQPRFVRLANPGRRLRGRPGVRRGRHPHAQRGAPGRHKIRDIARSRPLRSTPARTTGPPTPCIDGDRRTVRRNRRPDRPAAGRTRRQDPGRNSTSWTRRTTNWPKASRPGSTDCAVKSPQAVAAQRQSIDADMRGLRAQMTAVHKEFAETLARLVDEQIVKTIDARLQAVVEDLRETIREEARLKRPTDRRTARARGQPGTQRAEPGDGAGTELPAGGRPAAATRRPPAPRHRPAVEPASGCGTCPGSRGRVRASRCGGLRLSPLSCWPPEACCCCITCRGACYPDSASP